MIVVVVNNDIIFSCVLLLYYIIVVGYTYNVNKDSRLATAALLDPPLKTTESLKYME